jgi:uncharacterized membrane protein
MSYQERRAIVSLISTVLITGVYSAYMVQRYPEVDSYSAEMFRFWGVYFLILIPVTIVAKIVIHIGFSVVNTIATRENEPSVTDERDNLIELKSNRNALYVFSIGFLLAMASLVIELPPSVMFVILIGAGVLSEAVSDASQFYFYRRGF